MSITNPLAVPNRTSPIIDGPRSGAGVGPARGPGPQPGAGAGPGRSPTGPRPLPARPSVVTEFSDAERLAGLGGPARSPTSRPAASTPRVGGPGRNPSTSNIPSISFENPFGGIGSAIGGIIVDSVFQAIGGLLGFPGGFAVQDTMVRLAFKPGHPYTFYPGIMQPLARTGGMIWPYRPTIDITRAINYENISPTHSMQEFRSFRNHGSTQFTISGNYTAQTVDEARYLQASIHFLRTASMMSFGRGGMVPAGMPPPVLNLSAYGPNNMVNVPVLMDSMFMNYPNDVDYVKVDGNEIPTVMSLTASCSIQLSPNQLRNFSLDSFASGIMQNYI
jgi:hypothetical protein